MNEPWLCAVSAAAVWTDPDSPRLVDLAALDHPVQLERWLSQLSFEDRLALSSENHIQTQLLYGEPVIVEETIGDWAKVIAMAQPSRKDHRGYPGWVPLVQLSMRQRPPARLTVRVKSPKAWLLDESGERFLQVSFNTELPCVGMSGRQLCVWTPHGRKLISAAHTQDVEVPQTDPLHTGRQFLGTPYVWGGMSSWGYDCSGFVHNVWKACGVLLPRDAADQAVAGRMIPLEPGEWQRGDLLFFREDEESAVSHVGLFAGNGKLLHAPSTGKSVEYIDLASSEYAEKLCSVRRVAE